MAFCVATSCLEALPPPGREDQRVTPDISVTPGIHGLDADRRVCTLRVPCVAVPLRESAEYRISTGGRAWAVPTW
jgi:hypothetical protein